MARNNVSLSVDDLADGKFKIRWREDVVTDGKRERKARSQIVSDQSARDALVGKLRRTLETGDVFTPTARVVMTPGNLEPAVRTPKSAHPGKTQGSSRATRRPPPNWRLAESRRSETSIRRA